MRLFVVVRLCVFFWLGSVSLGLTTKAYAQTSQERVAVLEIQNKAGVKQGELDYLSDLLRQSAGKLPREHFLVMTKENVRVLLPPGKSLED